MKDPKRWQETLIETPFAKLTKQDVFDYYHTPKIQKAILDAVGNREAVVRQSFSPGQDILRRKGPTGTLITKTHLPELIDQRLTEIHPTFGKKVDFLLADIDPQKKVPWEKTKSIAETVAKTMASHPEVKDVAVRFSGGRGFYVQGFLKKEIDVNRARTMTKQVLDGITKRPDGTCGVAKPDQIRIDTTPLKFRGSVRAPYSLNASTGLVSAPVTMAKLPKVEKRDFTIQKIIKQSAMRSKPPIPESLLREALKDKWLRNDHDISDILTGNKTDVVPIRDQENVVGFLSPKISPFTKKPIVGDVFVTAGARGKGLGTAALREFAKSHPDVLSGIHAENIASKRMHEKAGFEPTGEKWKRSGNEIWRVKKIDKTASTSARILDRVGEHKPGDVYNVYGNKYRVDRVSSSKAKELKDHGAPDRVIKKVEGKGVGPDEATDVVNFHKESIWESPSPINYGYDTSGDVVDNHDTYVDPGEKARLQRVAKEKIKNLMPKAAAAEFAPGIPMNRKIHKIPAKAGTQWQLAVQKHVADKAGPHWDVRLVDPKTNKAHSFAVPKMKFPTGKEIVLGIQQPTHTGNYALHFEGNIPKGTYGAGQVSMALKEKVDILKSNADRILFKRPDGNAFTMFRMDGKKWGIRKLT